MAHHHRRYLHRHDLALAVAGTSTTSARPRHPETSAWLPPLAVTAPLSQDERAADVESGERAVERGPRGRGPAREHVIPGRRPKSGGRRRLRRVRFRKRKHQPSSSLAKDAARDDLAQRERLAAPGRGDVERGAARRRHCPASRRRRGSFTVELQPLGAVRSHQHERRWERASHSVADGTEVVRASMRSSTTSRPCTADSASTMNCASAARQGARSSPPAGRGSGAGTSATAA